MTPSSRSADAGSLSLFPAAVYAAWTLAPIVGGAPTPLTAAEPSPVPAALNREESRSVVERLLERPEVVERLAKAGPVTVLAVPDAEIEKAADNDAGRAQFLLERLVIPGRIPAADLGRGPSRWLLPLDGAGGFGEWAARRDGPDDALQLYALDSDGLPRQRVELKETDLPIAGGGLMHRLASSPKAGLMARGAFLDRDRCRAIFDSALERAELYRDRGQPERSVAVLERILADLALASHDTAAVLKGYLASGEKQDALPAVVPSRTFVILNAGFVRGLIADTSDGPDAKLAAYRGAVELAQATLDPRAMAGAAERTALRTLRDRLDSYREAVDLARHTLRLRDEPDGIWLGRWDVFAPGRGDLGQAEPK
ncbi:MAG: hypothetical protein AAF907_00990 [Planctomycetota bacterium]